MPMKDLLVWHPTNEAHAQEVGEDVLVQAYSYQGVGDTNIMWVTIHHGPREGAMYIANTDELVPLSEDEL